ncbi:MAG: serine/threonine-protein kinase [Deltaproteobacteria bacterium]
MTRSDVADGDRKRPAIPAAVTESIEVGDVFGVQTVQRGKYLLDPPFARTAPPTDGRPRARVGPYELVGRFPSSRTTMVFLAHKTSQFGILRRAVVKWAGRQLDQFATSREQLLDEARVIAFLEHPNLVKILDFAEDAAGMYLALEYVPGPDLRRVFSALMKRGEAMPAPLACFLGVEVLNGLAHAHDAVGPDGAPLDIVHRDVNPSNVLVSNDGHVKLTDFGMVHMKGRLQAPTAPHIVKGKYRYMAPEYIQDNNLTAQADLYGTGLMLFELLTGELCFMGDEPAKTMGRIVHHGVPYDRLDKVKMPRALKKILRRATAREPKDRYATARDMAADLERVLEKEKAYVSASAFAAFLARMEMPKV